MYNTPSPPQCRRFLQHRVADRRGKISQIVFVLFFSVLAVFFLFLLLSAFNKNSTKKKKSLVESSTTSRGIITGFTRAIVA